MYRGTTVAPQWSRSPWPKEKRKPRATQVIPSPPPCPGGQFWELISQNMGGTFTVPLSLFCSSIVLTQLRLMSLSVRSSVKAATIFGKMRRSPGWFCSKRNCSVSSSRSWISSTFSGFLSSHRSATESVGVTIGYPEPKWWVNGDSGYRPVTICACAGGLKFTCRQYITVARN